MEIPAGKTSKNKSNEMPSKKPNALVKKYSKETNAREYATANSKHYHVPFGNDANFVNHLGVAAIKIPQYFQNSSSTLARLARHPSAFTSMCGTDTAGRGALEPPPEGGARTKPYSTENSSSADRMLRPRQKTPDQSP